jgi:hypothetical protein
MWVVFNATAGVEIDRLETREERDLLLRNLRNYNIYECEYGYRWED